jgi:hypothetical protein
MVFFCVKGIYRLQDYYNRGFSNQKGFIFTLILLLGFYLLLFLSFFLTFQFFKNLENKSCGPVCHTTTQGYCNSSSFQNLITTCARVSSPADMIFNSSITFITDTDSQCYQFFIFLRKHPIFQCIRFNPSNLTKSIDTALVHLQIVLLSHLLDLITSREHGNLLK